MASTNTDTLTEELSFIVKEFSGGMRRNVDSALIADNEYPLAVNMRSRYGVMRPVKLPLHISDGLPTGKFQGCYGAGSQVLNFVGGESFIRDFSAGDSAFVRYEDTNLDPFVDIIYAVLLPESYVNYIRKPIDLGTGATEKIEFTLPITGSPACILAQDGINQGELLFTNGQRSRKAQTFEQWSQAEDGKREYVPVGKQMMFHDGILYIISPDQQEIYRSVTGRPLDFVIAVDVDGNKLNDNAFTVEASRWAHRVSFNDVTYIGPLNEAQQNPVLGIPFMVSTTNGTFKVTPSFAETRFGEPKFLNTPAFPSGANNQFSFVFINGDGSFVDTTGLRTFSTLNANSTVTKDTALSGPVYNLFEKVIQSELYSAAVVTDNYGIYAVNTTFGPCFLFWDMIRNKFDAIDIYSNVTGRVKMFCTTEINKQHTVYFITEDNKFYQLFGSDVTAEWKFLTKVFSVDDVETELKLTRACVSFSTVYEDGTITATDFVNGRRGTTLDQNVVAKDIDPLLDRQLPLGDDTSEKVDRATFKFNNSKKGKYLQLYVEGNCDVEMDGIQLVYTPMKMPVGKQQKGRIYEGTN